MPKSMLHLSIDTEILELAKNSNMNLSQEFEEWIRIRLNKQEEEKPNIDIDLEIAKYRQEIVKLQSQKELEQDKEMKEKEEILIIDNTIDNEIETAKILNQKPNWNEIKEQRIAGLMFLYKKRLNKVIDVKIARELLTNRLKDRKLI